MSRAVGADLACLQIDDEEALFRGVEAVVHHDQVVGIGMGGMPAHRLHRLAQQFRPDQAIRIDLCGV